MIKGNSQNFEAFWAKFDNYEIIEFNNEFYIKPSRNAEEDPYNLFNVSSKFITSCSSKSQNQDYFFHLTPNQIKNHKNCHTRR